MLKSILMSPNTYVCIWKWLFENNVGYKGTTDENRATLSCIDE
jgi:hypothetical protein